MTETPVNVTAGVNQLKTGCSKSISRLQMQHLFVVANIDVHMNRRNVHDHREQTQS